MAARLRVIKHKNEIRGLKINFDLFDSPQLRSEVRILIIRNGLPGGDEMGGKAVFACQAKNTEASSSSYILSTYFEQAGKISLQFAIHMYCL